MAIKPEDKPKLIGLIVALVGVLAYVLIVFVPKLTAGGTEQAKSDAPPPALTTVAANTTTPATGQSPIGQASAVLPDEDNVPIPPPPARDSFTPPPALGNGPAGAGGGNPGNPGKPAPIGPPAPTKGGSASAGGVTAVAIAGTPTTPVPPAPLPAIELKGVILGEHSVAVISVNGEVVQRETGDLISGGLKLAKISEVGITVQDGKRYLPVTVGHAMLVPSAAPPAQTQPQPAAAAVTLVKSTQ